MYPESLSYVYLFSEMLRIGVCFSASNAGSFRRRFATVLLWTGYRLVLDDNIVRIRGVIFVF